MPDASIGHGKTASLKAVEVRAIDILRVCIHDVRELQCRYFHEHDAIRHAFERLRACARGGI
jgi:hypothetical protein